MGDAKQPGRDQTWWHLAIRGWRSAPGRRFHLAVAVPLVMILWAATHPGFDFWPLFVAIPLLAGFGVVWLVRLVAWITSVERGGSRRWIVAPVMVLAAFALVTSDVPLRVRFWIARDSFDEVVEGLRPAGTFENWERLGTPDRIGTYEITVVYQVGENVIFYESAGSLFNDAGFAYLPNGPDARLGNGNFEAPVFRSLGGGWYAWTASW